MGEARFEELLAHFLTVEEQAVNSKSGGHPDGLLHFLDVCNLSDEPACAVGSPFILVGVDSTRNYGCICSGNPFGLLPDSIVKRAGKGAGLVPLLVIAAGSERNCRDCDHCGLDK